MRCYESLRSGEQTRAKVARLLDAGLSQLCDSSELAKPSLLRPVVLEEFTSLMDRRCAKQMARRIQNVVIKYKLRIVAGS